MSLLQIACNQKHDRGRHVSLRYNKLSQSYSVVSKYGLHSAIYPLHEHATNHTLLSHTCPLSPRHKKLALWTDLNRAHLHEGASTRDYPPKTDWYCLVPQPQDHAGLSLWCISSVQVPTLVPTEDMYQSY